MWKKGQSLHTKPKGSSVRQWKDKSILSGNGMGSVEIMQDGHGRSLQVICVKERKF